MDCYYVKSIPAIQTEQCIPEMKIKLSWMKLISSSTSETETN